MKFSEFQNLKNDLGCQHQVAFLKLPDKNLKHRNKKFRMVELNSGIRIKLHSVNLPTADAAGAAVRARGESCFLDAGNMCTTLVFKGYFSLLLRMTGAQE